MAPVCAGWQRESFRGDLLLRLLKRWARETDD
jgi:hypothetical protein